MSDNVRPVVDTLREINDGQFIDELSDAFNGLVASIKHHKKKGELTLKLAITPLANTDGEVVTITPQVSVKAPKQVVNTLFYVTDENNVQKRNPRQSDLPGLEVVDKDTGEVIEIESQSSEPVGV
jgi:ACT domain-containing protein